MAQFTKYSSSDSAGPGPLTGTVGSVLTVLDACLVNGYTGKTAAGWTKPFANASNIGCYVQGAGPGYGMVVNDNAPGAAGGAREARVTGWKSIAGVGSPVGSGSGQFPTGAQLLTTGCTVLRKSISLDSVGRNWVLYADSRQFMIFVLSGDVVHQYFDFHFGSIYSLWSTDSNNCLIVGGTTDNGGSTGTTSGCLDRMITPLSTSSNGGAYMADTAAGSSGSVHTYIHGDIAKAVALPTSTSHAALAGSIPSPNPADNAYYLSPLWVTDVSWAIRGRVRGLYQLCHPVASFTDGQTFNGANDYAGKTFQIIKVGRGGGMYVVETSNTLDTN